MKAYFIGGSLDLTCKEIEIPLKYYYAYNYQRMELDSVVPLPESITVEREMYYLFYLKQVKGIPGGECVVYVLTD